MILQMVFEHRRLLNQVASCEACHRLLRHSRTAMPQKKTQFLKERDFWRTEGESSTGHSILTRIPVNPRWGKSHLLLKMLMTLLSVMQKWDLDTKARYWLSVIVATNTFYKFYSKSCFGFIFRVLFVSESAIYFCSCDICPTIHLKVTTVVKTHLFGHLFRRQLTTCCRHISKGTFYDVEAIVRTIGVLWLT